MRMRRVHLALRLKPSLHADLVNAARENGNSLNAEISNRLDQASLRDLLADRGVRLVSESGK